MALSQLIDQLRAEIANSDIPAAMLTLKKIAKEAPSIQNDLILLQSQVSSWQKDNLLGLTDTKAAFHRAIKGILDTVSAIKLANPFPTPITINVKHVFGRDDLLRDLHTKLQEPDAQPLILVNGIGGIGKTTVAQAYISTKAYRDSYDRVVWISNCDDTQQRLLTFFEQHGATLPQTAPPEQKRAALTQYLQTWTGNNLLVLDNADRADQLLEVEQVLAQSGWKILLTSRVSLPKDTAFRPLRVDRLSAEAAEQLFRRFYEAEVASEEIQVLLKKVEFHALVTELVAKAAQAMDMPFADIMPLLDKEQYDAEELQADVFSNNQLSKANKREYIQLYSYLLSIFKAMDLSEEAQFCLACFSILPSVPETRDDLMDYFVLETKLKPAFTKLLKKLVRDGWLLEDKQAYRLHPMLGVVVRGQLQPNLEMVGHMVRYFNDKMGTQIHANPLLAKPYLPYGLAIWNGLDRDSVAVTDIGMHIARIYETHGMYKNAIIYNKKVVALRECILGEKDKDLAAAYNNIGLAYEKLGQFEEALDYHLKGLAIGEEILEEKHPNLATSYSNIAMNHQKLGQLDTALDYDLKALAIREEILEEKHPNLAGSYNNIAMIYQKLEQLDTALDYHLKALVIFEEILEEKHPNLAISYNNIAMTYEKLGQLEKALGYHLKALAIKEEILNKKHPNLATSYNNIAITYSLKKDYISAKKYIDQAVSIREAALPPTHPYIARSKQTQAAIHAAYHKHQGL